MITVAAERGPKSTGPPGALPPHAPETGPPTLHDWHLVADSVGPDPVFECSRCGRRTSMPRPGPCGKCGSCGYFLDSDGHRGQCERAGYQ